jgi:hypothetical protein
MINFDVFPTDLIMSSIFNFTPTESPGAGFTRMGNDTKVLTLFLGSIFLIGLITLLAYGIHGITYWCGKYIMRCKKIDVRIRATLYLSTLISFQLGSSFDCALGTLLKFEQV